MIREKTKESTVTSSYIVQNRAKEIIALLADEGKVQAERQKSAENRNKYKGVSSEQMRAGNANFGSSSQSEPRYGGFGSESAPRAFNANNFQSTAETTSKVAVVEHIPHPSKPAVMNLLDFDPIPQQAATLPKQNAFANFQSFQTAGNQTQKQSNVHNDDFGDFSGFQSITSGQPANHALGIQQQMPLDDFAEFQAAPAPAFEAPKASAGKSDALNLLVSPSNAKFGSLTTTQQNMPAFDALVNLDLMSVDSSKNKQHQTLDSIALNNSSNNSSQSRKTFGQ